MTGISYADWINAVAALLEYDNTITNAASATPSSFAGFNTIYPRAIDYAEQRMYRELDLLNTRFTDTGTLTANNRGFTLPTAAPGIFVVLEEVSVTVAGVTQPPLLPVSKDCLDQLYPGDTAPTTPSIPLLWAPVDQLTIRVAPSPDSPYAVSCFGTKRPTPLSATTTTTFLTQAFPDAFLACSMIFWSGFQRDFGAQSDDPKLAQSWESQYIGLIKSANVEEARKKWQANGWSARLPSPIATPPQT